MKLPVGPKIIQAIQLAHRANRPVLLEGPTGIGKSEMVMAAAASIDGGIPCICIDLSVFEPPDLIGIPIIGADSRTTYALPEFWPMSGRGIIFFDELNRASTALLNPTLQLLTTRKMNGYTLPSGWVPMAAMNPAEDNDYHGTNALDRALVARFSLIEVTVDVTAWLQWAERAGIHGSVVTFVRAVPDALVGKHSNPRAWVYISDVMLAYDTAKCDLEILLALMAGLIGDSLAVAFLATVQSPQALLVPDPESLIASYKKLEQESVRQLAASGDTAKLMVFTRSILLYLQDPGNAFVIQGNKKKFSNLHKLIEDLPAEYQLSIVDIAPWVTDLGGIP